MENLKPDSFKIKIKVKDFEGELETILDSKDFKEAIYKTKKLRQCSEIEIIYLYAYKIGYEDVLIFQYERV